MRIATPFVGPPQRMFIKRSLMIQPPFLQKGDRIGITCPAGYMDPSRATTCIETLQQWGLEVLVGNTLNSQSNNYFSASDEERRDELQAMLDDDSIRAILCGRGGYGTGRIIDALDFRRFKKHPKWIIGFSDITLLHARLNRVVKVASLHAPMAAAFKKLQSPDIAALKKLLFGKLAPVRYTPHPLNKKGTVQGELVGGNLALLAHVTGTKDQLDTRGKILFLEDVGELIYSADRMLYQLKRSGQLSALAGLIVGGFTEVKDTERPFGKSMEEAIAAIVAEYDYPVCFDFPISHGERNHPVKCGVVHELKISTSSVRLKEI